jgi:hypothetical protein
MDEETPVETATPEAAEPEGSPQTRETFAQTMERLGGFGDDDDEAAETPEAEPDKPAEKPVPAKGKGATKTTPDGGLDQLRTLAEKLGYAFDGARVVTRERAEFREWKAKQTEGLTRRQQEVLSDLEKQRAAVETKSKVAEAVQRAIDNGDPDGLAQALGKKDWNEVQQEFISRISDPNYKRLRQLETEAEQTKREKEEAAQREKQQQQQRAQVEQEQRYLADLGAKMTKSKDPVLAAMGDHPLLQQAILRIQKENWDGTAPLSPELALKQAARGASVPLNEWLRDLHHRLDKAFGKPAAPAPAAKPKPVAPKSAPVPPSRGTEASGKATSMSFTERREYERRRLAEAIEEDRKAGL